VRCGAQEHVHETQCYEGDALRCGISAHTHSSNCYLVLLKDNDINRLLSQVDGDRDKSLESLIGEAVGTALHYNGDLIRPRDTAGTAVTVGGQTGDLPQAVQTPKQEEPAQTVEAPAEEEEVQVSALNIQVLNETIDQYDIEPDLVLNEDLYRAAALEGGPTDMELPYPETSGGVSTLAVGDSAQTGSYNANFYFYLDGRWVCFGTQQFSVSSSGWRYRARLNESTTVDFINDALGTDFSEGDLNLKYATSANASDRSWSTASISGGYITLGSNYGQQSSARQAKYVRLVDDNGNALAFHTVTYRYPDGSSTTEYVQSGTDVKLPEDYDWTDGSEVYAGGQSVEINTATTFEAQENDGRMRIVYNVNFPTVSGVTVAVKPTLYGMAATTVTDTVETETGTVIRNVSQHEVIGKIPNHTADLSRVIRFSGWRVGDTDIILSPNSTLSWEELQNYTSGSRLYLYGVWETREVQTASFYIRYDSVAVDTEGNVTGQDSNKYTPELFATHVGGTDPQTMDHDALQEKYGIADVSADNSYTADQEIRALYGEQAGVWLQSFPKDADVFEQLKDYAEYLEVDGEPVSVSDLNDSAYAIRWYVFKCQSDAWHIDGRLVKKQGFLHITKSFAGNKVGVQLAKEDFSITAANDSGDRRGLTLNNYDSYDPATDTYMWELDGITYGEPWNIQEHTYSLLTRDEVNYHGYSEYNVVDIHNTQNKNGIGTSVDVTGMTYAMDEGEVQVLRVELTNIYHTSNSIIIKKEDARTGSALGGAVFRLMQNDEVLHFDYDSEGDYYSYNPQGTYTELAGSTTGYYEVVVDGFSYADGNVVVQELEAPEGYIPIENVVIGYQTDPATGQPTQEVGIISTSPLASYHDGLLIIGNTTESTSVTANKQWMCPEADWADVTVQLLANGTVVSTLIPGVEPEGILTAENGYSWTWDELPTNANGAPIKWSVREIRIGREDCKPDHSFANWIMEYADPVYTYSDTGAVTNTSFTIRNDTRRTLLRVNKTNLSGAFRLEGAVFTLQHLIPDGSGYTEDPTFALRTQTTGADGTLTFDNLKYGYYRLVETVPPRGYEELPDPIYLTIQEDGTVLVDSHIYAESGSAAYSVVVRNRSMAPLPDTGGGGTALYRWAGLGMMLTVLFVWMHPKSTGKRRDASE